MFSFKFSLGGYWHTLKRKRSICSIASSSSSEKSVRFSEENKTFYTHSPRDYDRSSVKQTCRLPASLGQTYLTVFEQILIENPLQDSIVKRNTIQKDVH
ncbi:hypothetical protein RMCBS344292_09899 [Rhizopus microsporus]|nr:hypothetical protein RMCBS344292_09899 [Rhizopus microsporus]